MSNVVYLSSVGMFVPRDIVPAICLCGRDVNGKPCEREVGHQGPCLHSLVHYGGDAA